jgi:hypothetical protein
LPLVLQRIPDRSPVLRRRFHDDFLDGARGTPLGQLPQLTWAGAELPAFKSPFPLSGYVRDGNCQHLLVDVDSGDPVRHTFLLA